VVLAIGAGVSAGDIAGKGLPSWPELLRTIAKSSLGNDGPTVVDDLRSAGFSLPTIAGMLRNACRGSFPELVRQSLYANIPPRIRRGQAPDHGGIVAYIAKTNSTLRAAAALCAVRGTAGKRYARNPLIHAVVNFNIDGVLRAYVHARYGDPLLVRSVERPSKSRELAKIPIYYMHGLLRFDSRAGRQDKEASDRLVLTEHEYFDFFNNPTGLFTYTFLHLLREHVFLFVGLSMQDDNIRRLLHYSRSERCKAYLDEGRSAEEANRRVCRHFAILPRGNDGGRVHDLVERSLRGLGVTPLWVDTFEDIPRRLAAIYERGGNSWKWVY
jgi:hypothetical protein